MMNIIDVNSAVTEETSDYSNHCFLRDFFWGVVSGLRTSLNPQSY